MSLKCCVNSNLRAAVAMLALLGFAIPADAARQKKEEGPPPPTVIKVTNKGQTRLNGEQVLVVSGVTAVGNKSVQLPVPNGEKNKYTPNEGMASVISAAKPGDFLIAEIEMRDYKPWLKKIEPYSVQPGEELPNTYIYNESFTQEVGKDTYTMVVLQKFGAKIDVIAPMKRNEQKQMVADAAITEAVGKFKKGDLVEANIQSGPTLDNKQFGIITSIDPYTTPAPATVEKVVETDIDAEQKGYALELNDGSKTVTALIPGKLTGKKWVTDTRLLSQAKGFKAGTAVLYRTREEGGKTWLRDIQLAPKAPKESATAKPSAAKGK